MAQWRAALCVLILSGAMVIAVADGPARASVEPDGWSPRDAEYGVVTTEDVPITMSDGAVLYADVHRPAAPDGSAAPGRFPTLLVQTPYNKRVLPASVPYLVERGYVDVVVDVRGTGASQGTFDQTFSPRSQLDGKELVDWAAAQDWSTGKVGLHGESYYGINQLLTAAQQPDGLAAIFPVVPTGDNYRSNFPGGYLTSLFVFSLVYASDGALPPGYTFDDPESALETLGSRPESVFLQTLGSAGTLAGDDSAYDGPRYHEMSPLWMLDRISTPTFLVGGWYDALSQRDAPLLFQGLQARDVPVKLVMGPWYHTTSGAGLPVDGLPSIEELQLRWFDRWVRGDDDPGLTDFGPVVYQDVGTSEYHDSPTWPPADVQYRRAHLDGTSSPAVPGALTWGAGAGGPDTLPWVAVAGGCTRSTYIGTFGLAPPTPCETDSRINDLTGLAYNLPLTEELTLAGPISAHLHVSSSTTDAFVTLRLESVDPATGTVTELSSGWDSLALRELDRDRSTIVGEDVVVPFHPYTKESVQQIEPGKVYDWWVEVRPIAATIPAGHVLRLSIQTADAIRFLPTAPRLAGTAGSVLTVYHDDANPSSIVLPVRTGAMAGSRGLPVDDNAGGTSDAATGGVTASAPLPATGTDGNRLLALGLALLCVLCVRRVRQPS